jgi:hypothetical protein
MTTAAKPRIVKKSVSLPEDLVLAAVEKAVGDPRYRTLSGYVQNLIDRDLKSSGSKKQPQSEPEEAAV